VKCILHSIKIKNIFCQSIDTYYNERFRRINCVMTYEILLRRFGNTKVVITRCQSKGGQYNGQQMGKKASNGHITTTQKIKVWATWTLLKTGGNLFWVTSSWYFWRLTFFRLFILQIASHILIYLMNEQYCNKLLPYLCDYDRLQLYH
jgi:hypothetical protein